MGHKGAAAPSPRTGPAAQSVPPTHARWTARVKVAALLAIVVILLGAVTFAAIREMSPAAPVAAKVAPLAAKPARPPKPALTPAEEAYIQALWPIHGEVERGATRMALGQILYKIDDMDRASLKRRVDDALATYRRSESRLRALQPPASVQRDHEEYLAAIQLFQQSAAEVLKMFHDGRDDHMVAAYPLGQKATDKIREVGGKFWPNEFPPN